MYKHCLIATIILLTCTSCGSNDPVAMNDNEPLNWTPENSSELNKGWIEDEQFIINEFVDRRGWEMTESSSGLRYMIYEYGSGEDSLAAPGQRAYVEFEVAPLGDTVVYRSSPEKRDFFTIEMDHIEYGIHEAVTYMRVGDRAKIILPHHLAHGLLGDDLMIPPLSAVLYDIKLVGLE